MIAGLAKSIFGSSNDRYVAKLGKTVEAINAFEPMISAMTDEELAGQTVLFRQRLTDGATLDDLLPEAFATVREAAKRTLGQRHYDVQMIGGIALHRGEIAEMRTGEGKTLVATLAVYLNALPGKGVHVVTVNDYLANGGDQMDFLVGLPRIVESEVLLREMLMDQIKEWAASGKPIDAEIEGRQKLY